MSSADKSAIATAIAIAIAFLAMGLGIVIGGSDIPECAEDDIIVGTGNYSHGSWEAYECSHPDVVRGGK